MTLKPVPGVVARPMSPGPLLVPVTITQVFDGGQYRAEVQRVSTGQC